MNRTTSLTIGIALLLVFSLLLVPGCAPTQQAGDGGGDAQPAPAGGQNQPVTVEIIARDGSSKEIDLTTLPQVTQQGGFKKSTGTIVGPAAFTGPALADVVGELAEGDALEIIAGDGYAMTYTQEQVQGGIMTYTAEGEVLKVDDLQPLLALECDDPDISEGLPRLVYTGPDAPITDGHFWIKQVATLKVVATIDEWVIELEGLDQATIDRSTFESLATCPDTPHPAQTYEATNKDGSTVLYEGVPLWVLVSTCDGAEEVEGHYKFNRDLAHQGYTIEVIAADGFTVEFESKDVAYNDGIILAYRANGEPLAADSGPLRLVGPDLPSKKHGIKQVAKIRLTNLP